MVNITLSDSLVMLVSILGVVITMSFRLDDESCNRARLTMIRVRKEIASTSATWSDLQQRIAIHLIRHLAWGAPSQLLVRKIRHVIVEESPRLGDLTATAAVVGYVETDEYVGLWPWQRLLIERTFKEVCEEAESVNSHHS